MTRLLNLMSTVCSFDRCLLWLTLVATLLTLPYTASVLTQEAPTLVAGHNVNMSGGEQALSLNPFHVRGDVLGRPANEPSCAISTRNPQHILCGANDYRMVDVPGVTVTKLVRDSWQGVYHSIDGGESWESTLHPGFFLDPQPSVLKQLDARASSDSTLRSGPAGLVFDSAIIFSGPDRDEGGVFVSTFSDLNNNENDRLPFKLVRTVIVDRGNPGQFIDKPWIFVEASGTTCTFTVQTETGPVTQTVPGSIVHVMYAVFMGNNEFRTQVKYSKSTNCGASFSKPTKVSETLDSSQAATLGKSLESRNSLLFAAWRRFLRVTADGTVIPDGIATIVSSDNGATWSKPQVFTICPFDQGTSPTTFRTSAFPTLTVDAAGRAYIAWSDRGRDPQTGQCRTTPEGQPLGAARVMVATSTNGRTWSTTQAVPSTTDEHQVFPSIAFTAGRLFLAWVDFKNDASGVYTRLVNEADVVLNSPAIRHTGDVRAAMATPGALPNFAADVAQVSSYLHGVIPGHQGKVQLQWNAVNRRWARRGTVAFFGDYIDIGTMPYLPPSWTPNTKATQTLANGQTVPVSPQVLVVWTDNRDMRRVPGPDDASVPTPYVVPAGLPGLGPGPSLFDPTQTRQVCTTAADAYKTGATNQNTYSARLGIGFAAGSPANNKDIGGIDRRFVVFVRNDTGTIKTFRLTAIPPSGALASFDQFDSTKTTIGVLFVPRYSSVTRTVYVTRDPASPTGPNPNGTARVEVVELVGGALGEAQTVYINSDPSAPDIDSPDIDSREVFTPDIDSPDIDSPDIDSHGFPAPDIDSPEIDSPDIDSQELLSLGLQTPDIDSPDIDSPDIDSMEIDSPDIDSPDIDSSAITDITFKITNTGNTTAQYNAKTLAAGRTNGAHRFQTIVRRRYPVATVDANCMASTTTMSKVAVNIVDARPGTPDIDSPDIDSPDIDSAALDTASFFVAPGETVDLVVRVRSRTLLSPAELETLVDNVEVAVQPEAVDSVQAALGITEPPVFTSFLSIITTAVPSAAAGTPYNFQLQSSGAVGATTWSADSSNPLPPGLTLTSSGLLIGSPTTAGTFTSRVFVQDSDSPPQTASRTLALTITAQGIASLAFVTQPSNTLVNAVISPSVSVRAINSTGAALPGIPVTLNLLGVGVLSGVLTHQTDAAGIAVFSGLSINTLATGQRLQATAPGFASPATSIAFNTTLPDLILSSLTHAPTAPTTSDTVVATAVVQNVGTGPSGIAYVMLQFPGETPGGEDTMLGIPPLAPGATYFVQRSIPPSNQGNYVVNATVDFLGQVAESNELNNTALDSYTVVPTALIVTNTNDSGAGSLRQAILDANVSPTVNQIQFAIPGPGPYTITPQTPLPTITGPVVIDGTTQPGFSGTPIIELSGALAGAGANGLTLSGGDSTVRGLVVNRWAGIGIYVHTLGNNVIAGNYVGTDVAGSGGAPSTRDQATNVLTPNPTANNIGIRLGAPNSRIGGTTAADRNLIAGNSTTGLTISPQFLADGTVISNGTGALVQGNYFGTDAAGTSAKPNGTVRLNGGIPNLLTGQSILVTAPNVTIGGSAPGTGNLISANAIGIHASTASANVGGTSVTLSVGSSVVIQGNLIGTDVTGNAPLPINVDQTGITPFGRGTGIQIFTPDSMIGGTPPGSGNVISGNLGIGIFADDSYRITGGQAVLLSSATNLIVQGNKIGTNAAGTSGIAGSGSLGGIVVTSPNIHIGGTAAGAGNVISGNIGAGIQVSGYVDANLTVSPLNTLIEGNRIGVNAAGTAPVGNRGGGILVGGDLQLFGVTANANAVIGGTTAASRNIIGGNGASGAPAAGIIAQAHSIGTQILGNFIGTNIGAAGIGNSGSGVQIEGAVNTFIGGTTDTPGSGAGNVISANADGIVVSGGNTGTIIQGNIVGLNPTGTNALGNSSSGVLASNAGFQLGGTDPRARNLIAGNQNGVALSNNGSDFGVVIQGNYIGTDITGTIGRGNVAAGVSVGSAPGTVIGGPSSGAGNLIAGNGTGIHITAISQPVVNGTYNALVQGNIIGPNATGSAAIGNTFGVRIDNDDNLIGGTTSGSGNVISGNVTAIEISTGADRNAVQGNTIGLNISGTTALGNSDGVVINNNATNNVVGGSVGGARNVISGNVDGVVITGATATNNQVLGNYIGLNAAGTSVVGTGTWGVLVTQGATNNTIGGSASGAGNVISGQTQAAVGLSNGATGNVVKGNLIGLNGSASATLGNTNGVVIQQGSANNTIGGQGPLELNYITGSTGRGVTIQGTGTGNAVVGNAIFNNAGLGIDLGADGVTPNDANDADSGSNGLQNFPVITSATSSTVSGTLTSTPNTTFTLQVFVNATCNASGFGEGNALVSTLNVTTNNVGDATFSAGVSVSNGTFATATATDPNGNTSEFGACALVGGTGFSGTLLDASGDAPGFPQSDITRGTVTVQGGNATLRIRFAQPFSAETGVQFMLDTDQSAATGNHGTDSLCVNDNGVIGVEYIVDFGPGSVTSIIDGGDGTQAGIRAFVGPGCNSFGGATLTVADSVVPIFDDTFTLVGMDVTLPVSMIGSDDGHLNFKVLTYQHIPGGNTFTGFVDRASEIGQPPGQVQ